MNVVIKRKLQIIPPGKVLIPGCEPTSNVSSIALNRNMYAGGNCRSATVDLEAVLAAIPDAKIVFGDNFGVPIQRWLELPPFNQDCECPVDYYGIIKSLANDTTQPQPDLNYCLVESIGYCPSPDFDSKPDLISTYVSERTDIYSRQATP